MTFEVQSSYLVHTKYSLAINLVGCVRNINGRGFEVYLVKVVGWVYRETPGHYPCIYPLGETENIVFLRSTP